MPKCEKCLALEEKLKEVEAEKEALRIKLSQDVSTREQHLSIQCGIYEEKLKQAEKKYKDLNTELMCELRDPSGTIWEHAEFLQKKNDELGEKLKAVTMERDAEADGLTEMLKLYESLTSKLLEKDNEIERLKHDLQTRK